jgi:DNA-binding Xre family transcriptional regulator
MDLYNILQKLAFFKKKHLLSDSKPHLYSTMKIYEKIKEFIKTRSIQLKELAPVLGITQGQLSKIINGKTRNIKNEYIKKLEAHFDTKFSNHNDHERMEWIEKPSCEEEKVIFSIYKELKSQKSLAEKQIRLSHSFRKALALIQYNANKERFINTAEFKSWLNDNNATDEKDQ